MPSHLKNFMKEERKAIQQRNKMLQDYVKKGEFKGLVNYHLMHDEPLKAEKKLWIKLLETSSLFR